MAIHDPPNPVGGSGADAVWFRRIWAAIRANKILPGRGYKRKQTTDGVILEIEPGGGGGEGAFGYRGTFDPNDPKGYAKNDIVRVRSGTAQGVWVAVIDVPKDATTQTWVAPVFPEPADQTPPSVNVWEMFALGVQEINQCSGGTNKKVYVNASDVF
jgi:hypothetical protein